MENGPPTKPTVWFKLQRAIPGGEPEDIPSEKRKRYLETAARVLSVQWENVKQTDIDGKAYTFSIVEGYSERSYAGIFRRSPGKLRICSNPDDRFAWCRKHLHQSTGSKTTKKIWAGGGPQPIRRSGCVWNARSAPTSPFEVAGEPIK